MATAVEPVPGDPYGTWPAFRREPLVPAHNMPARFASLRGEAREKAGSLPAILHQGEGKALDEPGNALSRVHQPKNLLRARRHDVKPHTYIIRLWITGSFLQRRKEHRIEFK